MQPFLASEPASQHDNPHETPIIHHAASFAMNGKPATTLIASRSHPATYNCPGFMVACPFGRTNGKSARFVTPLKHFPTPPGFSCPDVFHHLRS